MISVGNLLLSHIVFSKLPSDLERELIRSAQSNYLSVKQILQNAIEAIKTLLIVRNAPTNPSCIKTNKIFGTIKYEDKTSPKKAPFYTPKANRKPSILENFRNFAKSCWKRYVLDCLVELVLNTMWVRIWVHRRKKLREMIWEIEMVPCVSRASNVLLDSSSYFSFEVGHLTQVIEN